MGRRGSSDLKKRTTYKVKFWMIEKVRVVRFMSLTTYKV